MDAELRRIRAGKLSLVYLVHGSERYFRDRFCRVIHDWIEGEGFLEWNWVVLSGCDVSFEQVMQELTTGPWGAGSKVVMLPQAEDFLKSYGEKLVRSVKEKSFSTTLLLLCDKLDGRLKSIKELKKEVCEIVCEPLQGESLKRFVLDSLSLKQAKMTTKALDLFLLRVGENLLAIEQELDKLLLYVPRGQEIQDEHVEVLTSFWPEQLEQGLVFQFTDALAAKDEKKALGLLWQLLEGGEAPLKILPHVERTLRLLLVVCTESSKNLTVAAQLMGEKSDYPLKKASRYRESFSVEEILMGFSAIVQTDRDLKLGMKGELALEKLVLLLCTKKKRPS